MVNNSLPFYLNNSFLICQELLGFFLVANDETRRNVNSLIKVVYWEKAIAEMNTQIILSLGCQLVFYANINSISVHY